MKIFYLYVSAREGKEALYRLGKYPDTLFYGLFYLQRIGYQVSYSDKAFSAVNIFRYLFYPINRIFIYFTGYGFKLDQAVLLLSKLNDNDLAIACGSSAGLPLALLRIAGFLKKPVICIHMGGAEKVKNRFVIMLLRKLYVGLDKIIVFSKSEKELLMKKFGLNDDQVSFIPLGIDTDFFNPKKAASSKYFLSVGRDLNRDFEFLFEMFKDLKFPLRVVTSKRNIRGLDVPANVELLFDLPYVELKELYNNARAVILTLKPSERAAGQLVFLEALAMDRPVITTNTLGMLSGYEDLTNVSIVVNYKDKKGFADSIEGFDKKPDRNYRTLVLKKYSSLSFGKSLYSIVSLYE